MSQNGPPNVQNRPPNGAKMEPKLFKGYAMASEGLGAWFSALFCSDYSAFWRRFSGIFRVRFPIVIREPIDSCKMTKKVPHRAPAGLPNGGQIGLLAARPEVSWICYLLHFSHMGLPWPGPKWIPQCSPNIEAWPGGFFCSFWKIWGSLGNPIGGIFHSFLGPVFC